MSSPEHDAAELLSRLRLSVRELADEPASIRQSQLRDDALAALRDVPDPRSAVESALAQLPENNGRSSGDEDDGRLSAELLRPLVASLVATWPRLSETAMPVPADIAEAARRGEAIDARTGEAMVRLAVAMLTSLSQVGRVARESASDLDPSRVSGGGSAGGITVGGGSGADAWRAYQDAWLARDANEIERRALAEIADYVRSLLGVTR